MHDDCFQRLHRTAAVDSSAQVEETTESQMNKYMDIYIFYIYILYVFICVAMAIFQQSLIYHAYISCT